MLSNFKKIIRDPPEAPCPFETSVPCVRSRSLGDPPLPSSCSIIQVLYPPSYLNGTFPLPKPPPYPAREDRATYPSLPTEEMAGLDPLAEDPSLTGVPSQGPVPMVEPSPEEDEPLPVYSRVDQRRPRFPAASDVLGPYPPLSVTHQSTDWPT